MGTETRRVLAEIRRENDHTQLWFAGRQLSLDKLSPAQRSSISTLPTTIVIEADLQDLTVVGLGDTRAHPRTAALRMLADQRYGHAREYLDQLGEAVYSDVELLCAKLTLDKRQGRSKEAAADFLKLVALPLLDLTQALNAYELLSLEHRTESAPAFVGFAEKLGKFPYGLLNRLLTAVPSTHWGKRLPFLAIDDLLADAPDEEDFARAETILTAVGGAPEAANRIASAREQQIKREEKKKRALLAARPNFDEVEQLFAQKLPEALRRAWEAHYESERTVGFGFIEVKKGKVDKLASLAGKLERSLEGEEEGHRLLPFGIGEHDGDYFALDLDLPLEGDFAVRGVFNSGTGGNVLAYESSAAWIKADGRPKY